MWSVDAALMALMVISIAGDAVCDELDAASAGIDLDAARHRLLMQACCLTVGVAWPAYRGLDYTTCSLTRMPRPRRQQQMQACISLLSGSGCSVH
jgi:hypothetical protein